MVSEYNYINIREILSRILRHPLMQDMNLETAIQFTLDFIACMGLPKTYIDKHTIIDIEDYRGKLPCDCVAINQVRDCNSGVCMRYMTDNFNGTHDEYRGELTFKTQGMIIYTSFKKGRIEISYKAIPVDEDGLPLLPDNAIFLKALELYIKKEWFTILFDMGKISNAVLQNTQQEYYAKAGQCNNEFMIPSVSEMEAITRMWNNLIPKNTHFDRGFRNEGSREYLKLH
mgnify:CR=1 FL=1